jgi:hypothetical protein
VKAVFKGHSPIVNGVTMGPITGKTYTLAAAHPMGCDDTLKECTIVLECPQENVGLAPVKLGYYTLHGMFVNWEFIQDPTIPQTPKKETLSPEDIAIKKALGN